VQELGGQMGALLERVVEVERALGGREWWLLGRALAEARVLSEVASLLGAVRGELEAVLAQYFAQQPIPESDAPAVADDEMSLLNDPGWVQARRDEAVELLNRVLTVVPSLAQYAQLLHANAEHGGLPPAGVDALGIARDRLGEAWEALRPPA
jgi:hypothetical protein